MPLFNHDYDIESSTRKGSFGQGKILMFWFCSSHRFYRLLKIIVYVEMEYVVFSLNISFIYYHLLRLHKFMSRVPKMHMFVIHTIDDVVGRF